MTYLVAPSTPTTEAHLKRFIQWALHITSTGTCTGSVALELLDQAWNAQKLLWQLQEQKTAVFPALCITH